ncbi:hypothetical protein AX16_009239 [Volvariella volvacea WC 439]|nr:hypothetical protein AX16_009239 [Volvariella volvacea WC 439]
MVSRSNGDGTFGEPYLAIGSYGYDQTWRVEKHVRLFGDVTGDGYPDIIGFGENATYVSINNREGSFGQPKIIHSYFCYDKGWRVENHLRFVADLTGDGRVDLVGFASSGVWVGLNKGDGTFQIQTNVCTHFGYDGGWRIDKHPRFVVDLTGDGRADLIGFGNPGVYVALNNGDGTFQPAKVVLHDFGYDQNWRVGEHQRFLADLTGDGRPDIVGFGNDGVYAAFNDGKGGFSPKRKLFNGLGSFPQAGGWNASHIRFPANLYHRVSSSVL